MGEEYACELEKEEAKRGQIAYMQINRLSLHILNLCPLISVELLFWQLALGIYYSRAIDVTVTLT